MPFPVARFLLAFRPQISPTKLPDTVLFHIKRRGALFGQGRYGQKVLHQEQFHEKVDVMVKFQNQSDYDKFGIIRKPQSSRIL